MTTVDVARMSGPKMPSDRPGVAAGDAREGRELEGLRVVSFESRRAEEMAHLLRHHGAEPVRAPSMREIPPEENPIAREFARRLLAGRVDVLVLLTGVGTRALVEAAETECPRAALLEALARTTIVARGPKPIAALRELGLTATVTVPEPNTWREILTTIDASLDLAGRSVAVQEYGVSNPALLDGLAARGAEVFRVPVYRWALPENTGPLREAIRELAGGTIDIAVFTSATQVDHLLQVAAEEGLEERVRAASGHVVIASVGPVCSEALRERGLPVDIEPVHPKMGPLVREIVAHGRTLRERKRATT